MNTQFPNPIVAQVVGVSFEGRQEIISELKVGGEVYLEREPDNPFDPHAIACFDHENRQIGYLSRNLAALLFGQLDHWGKTVQGKVSALTGGYSADAFRGVLITFEIPW